MSDIYFVFDIGEDSIWLSVMGREELLKLLEERREEQEEREDNSDIPLYYTIADVQAEKDMSRWNSGLLIIKGGEIVTPVAVEVVKRLSIK